MKENCGKNILIYLLATMIFMPFYFTIIPIARGADGDFHLSFPLPNRDPYSAVIIGLFDHFQMEPKPYCSDEFIVTYTGEEAVASGSRRTGCDTNKNKDLYSYSPIPARIPNYNPKSTVLSYDGNSGYDYQTTDQSPDGKINVLAAADGIVTVIPDANHTTYIDHGNNYRTYYVHLFKRKVVNGYSIKRGQVIGTAGDFGSPGVPHLHFEVRKNVDGKYVPVDPYGWKGKGNDPYMWAANVDLWAATAPISTTVLPTVQASSVTPDPVPLITGKTTVPTPSHRAYLSGKTSMSKGEETTLKLISEIPSGKALKAYKLTLSYNQTQLDLLSATTETSDFPPTGINTNSPGKIIINGFNPEGVKGPKELNLLDIKLKSKGTMGESLLLITMNSYGAESNDQFLPMDEVFKLNIAYQTGDADGNGVVDIFDALLLGEYQAQLKKASELPGLSASDVDCNGKVDLSDALKIVQFDARIISTLECK